MSVLLEKLNNVQKEIVKDTQGAIMVLAGAGSGKTRVLTHRIAYILEQKLCEPWNILAITFTNKAANEMKERLSKMSINSGNVWALTFHSLCARLLRFEAQHLEGYTADFSIYDETDKKNVLKRICESLNYDKKLADEALKHISNRKNRGMTIDDYVAFQKHDSSMPEISVLMRRYEEQLKNNNAFDFDDLLHKTYELLLLNKEVREKYQKQFKYILVDEFQDTNTIQYSFVKILAGDTQNVFAVGDEDQSIYSWRGATVGNIQAFLKDFAGAKLYKLEQNYRSTKNILDKANKVIKHNLSRIDKTLWTENEQGDKVIYKSLQTDRREADFVAQEIYKLKAMGYKYSDFAVIMRMNALSRSLEDAFLDYNMPYKMFGGVKFYDRLEIKAIIAYLKMLVNDLDDESFLRVVNYPKRGIGEAAIAALKAYNQRSYLKALKVGASQNEKIKSKFNDFLETLDDIQNKYMQLGLVEGATKVEKGLESFVEYVIDRSGLKALYSTSATEEDLNRLENLKSFLESVSNFEKLNPNCSLSEYLQSVSLIADIDSYNEEDEYIVLSTIHAVKGLEFKVVFIIGLEEGYMPSQRTIEEGNIEEERRLMYVAVTRAMEKLYLTNAQSRFLYHESRQNMPSRFLEEMDIESQNTNMLGGGFARNSLSESGYSSYGSTFGARNNSYTSTRNTRMDTSVFDKNKSYSTFGGGYNTTKPKTSVSLNSIGTSTATSKNFAIGDRVSHPQFGEGTVRELNKGTDSVMINFDKFGNKILSIKFAPIKKIG